jgi:hypothetical protein
VAQATGRIRASVAAYPQLWAAGALAATLALAAATLLVRRRRGR